MDWNEKEMQLVILQVLLGARKQNPRSGGISSNKLREMLHVNNIIAMQKILKELTELKLIETFEKEFLITADGIDFLVANLPVLPDLQDRTDFCPPNDDPDSLSGMPIRK